MIDETVRQILVKFLASAVSLDTLIDFVDDYEWQDLSPGVSYEQQIMGTVLLYITEYQEGLREEDDLRQALEQFNLDQTFFVGPGKLESTDCFSTVISVLNDEFPYDSILVEAIQRGQESSTIMLDPTPVSA